MTPAREAASGRRTTSGHPRLIYLETLDPLLDADGGASRALFRLRRDFPWALQEGWELERWGLWRPGQRGTHDDAGRRIGLTLPARLPAHPALAAVAWLVHLWLAVTRPPGVAVAYNPFTGAGVAAAGL
ncbi:MAG TPA: hypothetical protein VHF25_05200, partial [Nitriliruptorales bacterium]|nr:hypothetical protein [Nitriliruptorales bacterium]